jgi:ATP-binding protein involved in chromosome partitioning
MQSITAADVETKLRSYSDPDLGCDLVSAKVIKNISVTSTSLLLEISLGFPIESIRAEWLTQLEAFLRASFPDKIPELKLSSQIETHVGQSTIKALPNIKNIIAVASGKGGVGKSTIAVNLALALAQEGATVGILDADIYGPSQPTMLGIQTRPEIRDKKLIMPIRILGIQAMSIGLLVDTKASLVWRGPMISMALQQLLNDTQWEALDYLIVDLPPGTGDIQLTLAQKIPVSGALVVTTPQELALKDVRRACAMFEKLNVPILGIVENMAGHLCSHCGQEEAVFGEGGAARLAEEYRSEVLARFPLDKKLREETDSGVPPVAKEPDGSYAKQFRKLARRAAAKVSLQTKNYSHKFPQIKVE